MSFNNNNNKLLNYFRINGNFDSRLVVLHVTLPMVNNIMVHVSSWCGGMNEKRSIFVKRGHNSFLTFLSLQNPMIINRYSI